ncbi:MAG: ABC transporter ATP-binding protein [Gammaproteobacteria bacterium]
MAAHAGAAVRIEGVSKRFGSLLALDDVGFDIRDGEFFGLLGPNGAGKSTLIGVIAGLVVASSGRVEIMGHDVVADFRRARAALGVVPQELVYDPFFSVRELLTLQAGYFGLGQANRPWIDELIETLDLADKADENLHALSGGMKRRVLIAQALVHKPRVVVLDEPTAGVDVGLRRSLWSFARRLHAEGHTIVLTTHYLEEAESLCDRIAVLDQGRLAALDSKQALLDRHPYSLLNLQWHGGALPAALDALVTDASEGKATLRLVHGQDQVATVLDAMRAAGLVIDALSTRNPGLEDVFMSLTGNQEP